MAKKKMDPHVVARAYLIRDDNGDLEVKLVTYRNLKEGDLPGMRRLLTVARWAPKTAEFAELRDDEDEPMLGDKAGARWKSSAV